MDRVIMFRGKIGEGTTWIYGGGVILLPNDECIMLHLGDANLATVTFVRSDTVGQYTGLKDKHGVKIFEGDILRIDEGWNNDCPYEAGNYPVKFEEAEFFVDTNGSDADINLSHYTLNGRCEVVGNRTDNSELLKDTA